MGKVSFELSIGYQKKKKNKRTVHEIKCASKNKIHRYNVNLNISWKKWKGPMTIEPEIERRKIERKRYSLFYQ